MCGAGFSLWRCRVERAVRSHSLRAWAIGRARTDGYTIQKSARCFTPFITGCGSLRNKRANVARVRHVNVALRIPPVIFRQSIRELYNTL